MPDAVAEEVELALAGWHPRQPAVPAPAAVGDELVLVDREAVPFARMLVSAVAEDRASGELERLRARSGGLFAPLHDGPVPDGDVVVCTAPLHRHDLLALPEGAVLVGVVGAGRAYPAEVLVPALAATGLPVRLLTVPAQLDAAAVVERWAGRPVTVPSAAGPLTQQEVLDLLDAGATFPAGFTLPGVEEALRRWRVPLHRRGTVLLFTGLSGSGKSTLARAVVERVLERTARSVTVLDGDVVRTMLSSGLGFSRPDRELNVRRIGWVAAEVARHGGTAVCAPIAPYAAVRAEVRAMAEAAGAAYVLVHVATPLEVCEARDRKGLYARARAGEIPEFTGISDPYDVPEDADVRVDTSELPLGEAVDRVWAHLVERGLVPSTPR
ncbi:adenylyl-sulfate kinase [Motilibacter rhizosphaerae]|uniref:Adenylyl-sulfate kinase n=1 Tax=Motilibacter rhizosphaerae TaxID=598652 RepID=A0A4V2F4Q1_9ACTN|nr:adenylyl-sulfate kinase [Motilibacter rhizosphaerae]RZS90099.1 adenylyl-sulfate kinase [Motilibacter rhizosphaerae]